MAGDGHARGCVGRRQRLVMLGVLLGLLLSLLPPAAPAQAAVFNVNVLTDPSPPSGSCPATCTLRNAITAAAPGDTIQFSVTGTIPLNAMLTLTKNVIIQGQGAASLVVDGQNAHGVFQVNSGVQASLSGLTIQRGLGEYAGGVANLGGNLSLLNVIVQDSRGSYSGGVYTYEGVLTVTTSTITNNRADVSEVQAPGYGKGGGIGSVNSTVNISSATISNNATRTSFGYGGGVSMTLGSLLLDRSTVSGNTAVTGAGLLIEGGALAFTNSTISGNTASDAGGGIVTSSGGTASLLHATLSGNAANSGGGIYAGGPVTLRNSIVVNSTAGGNCFVGGFGAVTSNGNNLTDSTSCFSADASRGDIVTNTPLLGPLALNAPGVTRTHALLIGSPAVDGVTFNPSDCPATLVADQRGVSRPQTWAGPRCDIGAYELAGNTPPTIDGIGTQSVNEDGPVPALFVTVNDAETPSSLTVTVTSSNQTLVPNANISISGGGLFRSLTVTPAANQSGDATITLTVNDGFTTTSTAFLFRVSPVNDPPVAVNDTYTISAAQTLNATVGSGVLANDTDIDGPSLTAQLVQGPSHGSVILLPNGAFTYQPTGTFAGTDSFTYRASDGSATSVNPATVSITVTPTACTPRPVVKPQLAVGGGKLQVRVEATPLAGRSAGPLRMLRFGDLQNAKVTVGGQTMGRGQTYDVPGNATSIDFTVERIVAGQPTTVPLTVVDDCGSWQTLVGGGASAGF